MRSESTHGKIFATSRAAILDCKRIFKDGGFRGVVAKYGWKIFAIFFVYYLTRDLILYVLLPYLLAKPFLH